MKRALFFAITLLVFAATYAEAKQPRPNILILLADQWRAEAFGYAGNPDVKTPHIDALAGESVNFKNAVAGLPVCCPTRASLLTGQRPLTHGVFINDVPLAPNAASLAKVLKAADYDTAYIGKWHLNAEGRSHFIPRERRQGFDHWKVLECTHDYNDSFYFGDTPEKLKWPGYDAIAQTRDTQEYLRNHAKNEKPFLFMLSWGPPHNPYASAPEKYKAMYNSSKLTVRGNVPPEMANQIRRDLAGYYAHCTALDDCVGDLLQTLRETGLAENTIVVFTADHGDMLGSHGFARKQKPWDESIRIPMLVHWPRGLGKTPRQLDTPIASEDFMPTLLGLCDVRVPKTVEGKDYSRLMHGGKKSADDAALISCITPFGEWDRRRGGKEYRGIRTERFTYARDLSGPWLLFDNEIDPLQMTNLVGATSQQKLQRKLDDLLQRKLRKAGDAFLPGDVYVKKWGYQTNEYGTVPHAN